MVIFYCPVVRIGATYFQQSLKRTSNQDIVGLHEVVLSASEPGCHFLTGIPCGHGILACTVKHYNLQIRRPWRPISTVAKLDVLNVQIIQVCERQRRYFPQGSSIPTPWLKLQRVEVYNTPKYSLKPLSFGLAIPCALQTWWHNFSGVTIFTKTVYSKSNGDGDSIRVSKIGKELLPRAQRFAVSVIIPANF